MSDNKQVTVKITEAILYATITDLYNNGHVEWIAEDGTRVMLTDGCTPCDECGERIPDITLAEIATASLANRHHADSCSLYDPAGE